MVRKDQKVIELAKLKDKIREAHGVGVAKQAEDGRKMLERAKAKADRKAKRDNELRMFLGWLDARGFSLLVNGGGIEIIKKGNGWKVEVPGYRGGQLEEAVYVSQVVDMFSPMIYVEENFLEHMSQEATKTFIQMRLNNKKELIRLTNAAKKKKPYIPKGLFPIKPALGEAG
jgi:hypothetical protein